MTNPEIVADPGVPRQIFAEMVGMMTVDLAKAGHYVGCVRGESGALIDTFAPRRDDFL